MTKAEFLTQLERAVNGVKIKFDPANVPPLQENVSYEVILAWSWVHERGIFIGDSQHQIAVDNPVVRVVAMLGKSAGNNGLTLTQLTHIETAWEYFDKKQTQATSPEDERITKAIEFASRFGGSDELQHLQWVIDQMVRTLAGDNYHNVVKEAKAGINGPDTFEWHVGIAP